MTSSLASGVTFSVDVRPGNVYLVEERRPRASYELFEQVLSSGSAGLVITRDFPKKLLSEKELDSCKIVWMTNLVGEGRVNPTAIGILMSQVRTFIESQKRTAVVIDGLEYLVSLNTYDRMLQFMHQLRDLVVTNDCVLIVPVDPRTMSEREIALLERSMEVVVPRAEPELGEEQIISSTPGEIRLMDIEPR
ncbi:MAG: DUF835 domain-containing protein [Thermoplasmata archaeon]